MITYGELEQYIDCYKNNADKLIYVYYMSKLPHDIINSYLTLHGIMYHMSYSDVIKVLEVAYYSYNSKVTANSILRQLYYDKPLMMYLCTGLLLSIDDNTRESFKDTLKLTHTASSLKNQTYITIDDVLMLLKYTLINPSKAMYMLCTGKRTGILKPLSKIRVAIPDNQLMLSLVMCSMIMSIYDPTLYKHDTKNSRYIVGKMYVSDKILSNAYNNFKAQPTIHPFNSNVKVSQQWLQQFIDAGFKYYASMFKEYNYKDCVKAFLILYASVKFNAISLNALPVIPSSLSQAEYRKIVLKHNKVIPIGTSYNTSNLISYTSPKRILERCTDNNITYAAIMPIDKYNEISNNLHITSIPTFKSTRIAASIDMSELTKAIYQHKQQMIKNILPFRYICKTCYDGNINSYLVTGAISKCFNISSLSITPIIYLNNVCILYTLPIKMVGINVTPINPANIIYYDTAIKFKALCAYAYMYILGSCKSNHYNILLMNDNVYTVCDALNTVLNTTTNILPPNSTHHLEGIVKSNIKALRKWLKDGYKNILKSDIPPNIKTFIYTRIYYLWDINHWFI